MDTATGRWWALGALNLAVLAVGLDGTVLSVALPTLAGALHATESDLQWFTSGYLLVLAATMLPAGLLGDRYGRRTVLVGSLALFGAGSAACAFAPNPGAFIAARTVVGIAGAGIIVMALASITVLFSEAERPKAIGVWSAANFLATPVGPILGGWLLSHYWWGWVFLINLPIAAIGLVVAAILVPQYRTTRRPGIDWVGIASSTVALVAITYGLIEAGEHGWGSAAAITPIVAGALIIGFFFRYERRTAEPLVDPVLFRSRSYTWGVLLVAVAILAMTGVLFLMPQFFQGVLGTDAMGSGLRLLPLIVGLVAGALPANVVARALGTKLTVAAGFAVFAAGLGVGVTTTATSGTGFVALWMALVGAGMGLALATASSAALSVLSEEHGGIGSAVLQAVNKVGGPFGAAVLGSVQIAGYRDRLPGQASAVARQSVFGGLAAADRLSSPSLLTDVRVAFTHGLDMALVVSLGVAVAGLALALVFLPRRSDERRAGSPPRKEFDSAAAAP
ncbi:MAG TPA: DHA2 family efflux MFS transporter permease subunit [Pseudonocardiaceae bacterium]|nr:DHA2 family efflux MFS transporter permease subunit [Pseudonocardiaceae bacterium]